MALQDSVETVLSIFTLNIAGHTLAKIRGMLLLAFIGAHAWELCWEAAGKAAMGGI